VLPLLGEVDLVLTDPPYPTWKQDEYRYEDGLLEQFREMTCQQFIFWTPAVSFPLDWCGMHVWDKATGSNTQFELIYQRGRGTGYKIHRYISPHNSVRANWCGDVCLDHYSQKPFQLIRKLFGDADNGTVLDPFMGSGTTLRAAKDLGRRAIGIEIEERYCEIAANRLRQEVLF
jgi:DNA modification methylase